ncbi:WD40 repeat domain-containing protein [Streptomyces mirabilis]|uniref:WD40 repeat domain-containing protein n=1 Tax=Streptomyces mirabilis TaxID=68239 RepID=UPI003662A083
MDLGQHAGVWALATLPDGRIVSGGHDGQVRLWDLANPDAQTVLLDHHDRAVVVAELPDGRVANAGQDRQIRL